MSDESEKRMSEFEKVLREKYQKQEKAKDEALIPEPLRPYP